MKYLKAAYQYLLILLVPVLLLLSALRILLTPTFVKFEYSTPNFPPDSYGFSQEQRLFLAPLALTYLLNDSGPEFLGDLTFADGSPLYNAREISHMVDVKILVQKMLPLWIGLLLFYGVNGLVYWQRGQGAGFRQLLARGGQLTIILILLLLLGVAINFNSIFTKFHELFFEGNSWIFYYSDTLIRLFPIRFWRDAFIVAGFFTVVLALGLWQWDRLTMWVKSK